jgi:hypothetical protein
MIDRVGDLSGRGWMIGFGEGTLTLWAGRAFYPTL